MAPLLREGDLLLVSYAARPSSGSLVLARFADGTVVVKRAAEPRTTRTGEPGWWLVSEDPGVGVDSRHRGPVRERDVMAVIRGRLWPRPSRLR